MLHTLDIETEDIEPDVCAALLANLPLLRVFFRAHDESKCATPYRSD